MQSLRARLHRVTEHLFAHSFAFENDLVLHQTAMFAGVLKHEGHERTDVGVVARVVRVDQVSVSVELQKQTHVAQSFN